jgi:hypothetical protein
MKTFWEIMSIIGGAIKEIVTGKKKPSPFLGDKKKTK